MNKLSYLMCLLSWLSYVMSNTLYLLTMPDDVLNNMLLMPFITSVIQL